MEKVNNDIYFGLSDKWYIAEDNPVALLRAEANNRNPWMLKTIHNELGEQPQRILDIGCGAGFTANVLANHQHDVWGVDVAEDALIVAKNHDSTNSVRYTLGSAEDLPFGSGLFDVVCAFDLLEHVEDPILVVSEASRVLRPGGLFFFHTFNRNWLSWLVVIKGVEWFVKNTPKHLHIKRLFVKPEELRQACEAEGLRVEQVLGSRPVIFQRPFLKLLFHHTVDRDFKFTFQGPPWTGYTGYAVKL